jgi:hypothetical protein
MKLTFIFLYFLNGAYARFWTGTEQIVNFARRIFKMNFNKFQISIHIILESYKIKKNHKLTISNHF